MNYSIFCPGVQKLNFHFIERRLSNSILLNLFLYSYAVKIIN